MQDWKDDILRSMEGAHRAEPNPDLYAAIQAKIRSSGKLQVVSKPYLALAAACFAVLLVANIRLLSHRSGDGTTQSGYQIEAANFSLY